MSPADKGLQIPERGSAPVEDPAITAAKKAEAAKAAWLALPHSTFEDEETPEYQAAETRWHKAEEDFAAAPVTSIPGVFVKLSAMLYLIREDTPDGKKPTWTTGHVDTLSTFLEGFTGEAQAEPLVELWTERNRLVALCNAADTDPEIDGLGVELSAVERRIANTEARTLAGVVLQIKLRESVLGHDHWVLSADLTRNVVTALERMGGSVVTEPDPAVVAGKELAEAIAAFDTMAGDNPEFDAAHARMKKADEDFADAPVTSAAGVLAKLEELRENLFPARHDPDETDLDTRHFNTVVAFLKGRTVATKPDSGAGV